MILGSIERSHAQLTPRYVPLHSGLCDAGRKNKLSFREYRGSFCGDSLVKDNQEWHINNNVRKYYVINGWAMNFLDLFAGAGGLSEGFVREGFIPVAHVEGDAAACFTLRTRSAFHWFREKGDLGPYNDYVSGKLSRDALYSGLPENVFGSVLNEWIGGDSLSRIFDYVESRLNGRPLDLIVGGPPCQAFSLVGRSKLNRKQGGDARNYLYTFYVEFLKKFRPRAFVFENVVGLLSARTPDGELFLDKMLAAFKAAGYEPELKVVSADSLGVLQKRERVIVVGVREGHAGDVFELPFWDPGVLVREVFADLPALQAGEGDILPCRTLHYSGEYLFRSGIKNTDVPVTFHQARPHARQDLQIYSIASRLWSDQKQRLHYNDLPDELKTHRNRDAFVDRFKVVAGDLPASHTVLAHIAKDGHYYIHPDASQNRSLTPREAARLQSFPDDFFFESVSGRPARTTAFKQIGNAVPVLMAQKIAQSIREKVM